ncbi:FecR family protein [Chitinophaga silvisoli]|uniref:FecR family protein n=1 Tax=Chitinophaga silvisoli TaxID=2291814 RepID=A0A3E1P8J2_9BACT|nr:FecR family protein [Chitinophaga silvisoli]RFM36348.1 FecR family protein [Chitinophaga silvisoli]
MNLDQIKKILERYNEEQSTAGEKQLIEEWFEGIQQPVTHIPETVIQQDLADVHAALQKKINMPRRRTMRPWFYAAAAITMLVAAASWFFQHYTRSAIPAGQTPIAKVDNHKEIIDGCYIITTVKGKTEHLQLEDGSTVVLNAGSRLRYPVHFRESRELYLEDGEAYFDVAPDPAHHFTVHSGGLSTTALGTSFNIRAYRNEQKITVALLSGKVQVTASGKKPVVLESSEQLSYDLQSLQVSRSNFSTPEATAWQQGTLVFKDASYEQVRNAIENTFAVTIINQSDKKAWTYTGSFRQETLQNVLETICLTESLSWSKARDTVILKNKK